MSAHWERGYRVHGYWDDNSGELLGRVGLSPYSPSHRTTYWATFPSNPQSDVAYRTLRAAKKRVERELAEKAGIG